MTGLGAMFERGDVGGSDVNEALRLYTQACGENESQACRNIGKVYMEGVPGIFAPDPDRAVKYFTKSCLLKNGSGCNSMGYSFSIGRGSPQDRAQALFFYQKSCALGYALGCVNTGEAYEKGEVRLPVRS